MMNRKFFPILIGIIIAIIAIWNSNIDSTPSILENFINVPMTVKRMPSARFANGKEVALQNDYNAMVSTNGKQTATLGPNVLLDSSKVYMTPPNFQNVLSPRLSNQGYGAYINYNLPDDKNLAVPTSPLGLSNMVSEGFCSNGGCGSVQSCRPGGVPSNKQSMDSDVQFNPSYVNAQSSLDYSGDIVDELPLQDMTVMSANGESGNVVIADRFMFANQKSRLAGLGCTLRGDLPCKPDNLSWFQVSATPHIDLRQGALAVMGGINNDTAQSTYALSLLSSGGYNNTQAGVNLSETIDISSQKMGFAGNNTNELSFTAFP